MRYELVPGLRRSLACWRTASRSSGSCDVYRRVARGRVPARLCLLLGLVGADMAAAEPLFHGDQGYAAHILRDLPAGLVVDATAATFRVASSQAPAPSKTAPCDAGPLTVNRYPLQLRDSPRTTLRGGQFEGEVSLEADWQHAYCNSAAIVLRDSPEVVLEGQRMRRVWDGVRIGEGSTGFVLRGVWLSEVRDDCIEDDFLIGGRIVDSLFDGCFSGLSLRPPNGASREAAGGPVLLRGVLMRMETYLYKGAFKQGVPLKAGAEAPALAIHDSIIAMDGPDSVSKARLSVGWSRVSACSGNLLLWMSDEPWPKAFARPPGCFRQIEGAEARAIWEAARRNWIDCHSAVGRFPDDPAADPAACDATAYGGRK